MSSRIKFVLGFSIGFSCQADSYEISAQQQAVNVSGNSRRQISMKKLLPDIINKLDASKVNYEVHNFESGAVMVDIFINEKFFVVQIDGDEIGLSIVTKDTGPFDIIPDKPFKDPDKFKVEFEKIFG